MTAKRNTLPCTGAIRPWLVSSLVIGLALAALLALSQVVLAGSHALQPPPGEPATPLAVIDACGEITSDTTWIAGNVYTAHNCNVIVNSGVTLTIQAGAIAKFGGNCYSTFDSNCAFVVKGKLRSQGTEANPVIITSWGDDAHGGDTNEDGSSTGRPGEWYGIHFMPGSQGELDSIHVFYAGSGQTGRWDSTSYYGKAQIYINNAAVSLDNAQIAYSPNVGIALYGGATQAVVENTHIISNTGQVDANCPGGIYQHTLNMSAAYHNLTLQDNSRDVVALYWDTFTGDVTLDGAPLNPCPVGVNSRNVPSGRALTLMPGTLLRFRHFEWLIISNGGHLTATGTLTQPVKLASLVDDSSDWVGKWDGVYVDKTGSASFLHAQIRQGGMGFNQPAALWVRSSDVKLKDVVIHHSWNDGLRISHTGTAAMLDNVSLHDNARDGLALYTKNGHITMTAGEIYENGRYGIHLDTSTLSGEEKPLDQTLTLNEVLLRDNTDAGLDIGSGGSLITLQDTDITGNSGAAIRMHPDNDTPVLINTTLTSNALDGIAVAGGWVEAVRHWGAGNPQMPYIAEANIFVRNTGGLSLEPGMTLRIPAGNYIGVNGNLTALGTPERPIRFWGVQQSPGGWQGIILHAGSSALLQHCDIAYGGRDYWGTLSPMLSIQTVESVIVQDCAFHDSFSHGVNVANVDGEHLIRNSRFNSIPSTAAGKTGGQVPLDARYNWWGHSSGPKHNTLNPSGQGVTVGNNVLFDPWLTESPVQPGGLVVDIHGPGTIFPGQTVNYALAYTNYTTETVQSAVLVMQLPTAGRYLESTHGGRYWIERHQVFWRLGDIAPEGKGEVSVQLRYRWGLPPDFTDTSIALLLGTNLNEPLLEVADYLAYEPTLMTGRVSLSDAEFAAERTAYPDLQALYDQALSEGFYYGGWGAERMQLNQGTPLFQAILVKPDRSAVRFLRRQGDTVNANTYSPQGISIHDSAGGVIMSMDTHDFSFSGVYADEQGASSRSSQCGVGTCLRNCLMGAAAKCMLPGAVADVNTVLGTSACISPTSDDCVRALRDAAMMAAKATPVVGCVVGGGDCVIDCTGDVNTHCCTGPKYMPASGVRGYVLDVFGVRACEKWECNPTLGSWGGLAGFTYCPTNERCVSGTGSSGGCRPCEGSPLNMNSSICSLAGSGSGVDCKDSSFRFAADPNEKFGPPNDLLPGQLVTYTITYENEGDGNAYGVYIVDELSEVFDDATLDIQGGGRYLAGMRTLLWEIGELMPKGQPGSTGVVTFTVRLRDNLPGGTVVVNEAVVYFPSVPEVTPTGAVVNVVQPVVALPQTITTTYTTPVSITLTGVEVSGAPLTFTIVDEPQFGGLTGELPNLTYTPIENYAGPDHLSFAAGNGLMDSRPADIHIIITPEGDATPPQVTWVDPSAASVITPTLEPIYSGDDESAYRPSITLQFSEPLDPTSITSDTLRLNDAESPVGLIILYDSLLRRITGYPNTVLQAGKTYTVTASTGITDLAGNPLAENYQWSFYTAAEPGPTQYMIFLPVVLR